MDLITGKANKAAEMQQRQQLAALARSTAQTDQLAASGRARRGSQLLDFARTSLSGDGQANLG